MKLTTLGSIVLLGVSSVVASGKAAVFELGKLASHENLVASLHESESYFADKFGVGEYHSVGHGKHSIELIQKLHSEPSEKPNLVFVVKGVDEPNQLFANLAADNELSAELSFEISFGKDREVRRLVHWLFGLLPREYAQVVNATHVTKVSDEISLVTPQMDGSKSVKHVFKRLHSEMPRHWQNFFSQQATMDLSDSGLNVLNDKLFINEILQVSNIAEHIPSGLAVANFDSLLSLGTKLGYKSSTYQLAKKTLAHAILALGEKFEVTVVALGPGHKAATSKHQMDKRSSELSEVFAAFTKGGALSSRSFFSDEDACVSATNNCTGHGACTKVGSKKWQCACKPTYNKKLSKTTNWAGADCSKKDIAAQANLLLWTSVALLVTLVGGIKLLFSIGSESLPGVLEAATVKRSS